MGKIDTAIETLKEEGVLQLLKDTRIYLSRSYKRAKLNRKSGISIHPTATVQRDVQFGYDGSVSVGKKCILHSRSAVLPFGGYVKMGDYCSVNPFTMLYGQGGLDIGSDVRIAAHTVIIPANHKYSERSTPIRLQGSRREGIEIEDDVWIGSNCTILDGITVGEGSVIAAGSVVTKSVPEYTVVGGNPATKIKSR